MSSSAGCCRGEIDRAYCRARNTFQYYAPILGILAVLSYTLNIPQNDIGNYHIYIHMYPSVHRSIDLPIYLSIYLPTYPTDLLCTLSLSMLPTAPIEVLRPLVL